MFRNIARNTTKIARASSSLVRFRPAQPLAMPQIQRNFSGYWGERPGGDPDTIPTAEEMAGGRELEEILAEKEGMTESRLHNYYFIH